MRDRHDAFFLTARLSILAHPLSPHGNLASYGSNASTGFGADALDRFGDLPVAVGGIVGALFLDVEVFGVLADDDKVDGMWCGGFEGGGQDGLAGTDIGVEGKAFAQRNDGGGVAGDFGSWGAVVTFVLVYGERKSREDSAGAEKEGAPDSSKQSSVTFFLQSLHSALGQRGPGAFEAIEAGVEVHKGEIEAQRRRQRL